MDDIVKQAMVKWPNVPDCYGWLALDARGAFRMRDEAAQANNLPGDRILHTALLAFIHRNYAADAKGGWFFQNGPQRVYVDLEATPFIARTDPAVGFVLHDGQALGGLTHAYMTEQGQLILQQAEKIAMLDDRDLAQCLPHLRHKDMPLDDTQLINWLAQPDDTMYFVIGEKTLPLQAIQRAELARQLGFQVKPRA